MIEEESGTSPCSSGMLHATTNLNKWNGDRIWLVKMYEPVIVVDEDKMASRKREIVCEAFKTVE